MCEHGGGIALGGESLCWDCYQQAVGAVYCPGGERMAMPDKFGCDKWRPAEASAPMRWCYWCQDYRAARWPEARATA